MANSLTKIDDRGLKTPIDLLDNEKIRLGTGNDLEIYHSGSHSFIANTGGQLNLRCNTTIHLNDDAGYDHLKGTKDGSVEIYYDGTKKLETTSDGVTVTGKLTSTNHVYLADDVKVKFGASDDLEIFHDGSASYIKNTTGNLVISDTNGDIHIQAKDGEHSIVAHADGSVKLYHNNVSKFETYLYGIKTTGHVWLSRDSDKAYFGAGSDLEIFHDGTHSRISAYNTGNLLLKSQNDTKIEFGNSGGATEVGLHAIRNGAVELYYDNSLKIRTASHGLDILDNVVFDNGTNSGKDINWIEASNEFRFQDDVKATFGADDDLSIYHDGSNNYIDGNSAAEDHLYIRANVGSDQSSNIYLQAKSGEDSIVCRDDESTELYYDGSKKLETTSTGVNITNGGVKPFIITAGESEVVLASTGGGSTKEWRILGSSGGTTHKFRIYDGVAGADRLNIDSSGRVGIGTTSPASPLHLHESSSGSIEGLKVTNSTTGTAVGDGLSIGLDSSENVFIYNYESTAIKFGTSGSERLRIKHDGGITFNGDTAAANALDDYEEGTHTTADSSGQSVSITNEHSANYVKIGQFVYLQVDITYGSTSDTNHARITVPFQSGMLNYGGGSCGWTDLGRPAFLHCNTDGCYLMDNDASGATKHLTNSECAGKRFIGQINYKTTA